MSLSISDINILRQKIGNGDKLFVLEELIEKLTESFFYDEILLLSSNYNLIEKKKRTGQISLQDELLAESSLANSLLEILRTLEKKSQKVNLKNKSTENKIQEKDTIGFNTTYVKDKRDALNLLIVGQTGVGKSSFINSVARSSIARVGEYIPTTLGIDTYKFSRDNTEINIIDMPGLSNDLGEPDQDELLKEALLDKVDDIDIIVFIKPAIDNRVASGEMRGFKFINDSMGRKAWKKTVFVLSFADQLMHNGMIYFSESINQVSNMIRKRLLNYADVKETMNIKFIPMYYQRGKTDEKEADWTHLFWKEASRVIEKNNNG